MCYVLLKVQSMGLLSPFPFVQFYRSSKEALLVAQDLIHMACSLWLGIQRALYFSTMFTGVYLMSTALVLDASSKGMPTLRR